MQETPTRKFYFHANAHVLSAQLTRPVQHTIAAQAATSLPTIGGVGSARVDNFRFNEHVSFKAGYSHVSGTKKEEQDKISYTTMATAVVEGLNILDVVTADRIVARLSGSCHPDADEECRILILGSRFENLRIAGHRVEVELHHELALKLDTFEAARKEFASNTDFRKMAQDPFDTVKLPNKIEPHGVIPCSMVKELRPATYPGVARHGHYGHVLQVPEFGKVYLAEILFRHSRKTLTMLRVELGSPNGGLIAAVAADSNGDPWPG